VVMMNGKTNQGVIFKPGAGVLPDSNGAGLG
jgi:hypothetical protein